jgi:hypothetical protein
MGDLPLATHHLGGTGGGPILVMLHANRCEYTPCDEMQALAST